MGVYLGIVEEKGYDPNIFFNFKPLYEIRNGMLLSLSPEEQRDLLPESENRNINFLYNFRSSSSLDFMRTNFVDGTLILFEFSLSDLDDNYKVSGERNPTGYRVPAEDFYTSGKIRSIDSAGLFYIINKTNLISDFYKDSIVEIAIPAQLAKTKVLVDLRDIPFGDKSYDDIFAGPYEIGYRELDKSFYIKPQIKDSKYTISGYYKAECKQFTISTDERYGAASHANAIAMPQSAASVQSFDVISNEALLEGFYESLTNDSLENGKIDLSKAADLLSHYENSLLTGSSITKEIRTARLNKLVEILTSESEVDDTLSLISESLCDLLIKYKNSPNVDELVQELIASHPEFLENLRDTRTIREQINKLTQELESLRQEQSELQEEISSKQQETVSVEKEAIERKKVALLEMDGQYTSKKEQLDNILRYLGIANDVKALDEKQKALHDEADYIQQHKNHLEIASKSLETQFLELINNYHERMVDIAFDGFMSNRMLKASAEWEAEENRQSYDAAVRAVSSLPASEKTPEELIEYLCHTVQIARPQYTRNTIINIAICISQGFLTVFSGEPGCGKTSICNIVANVLGLNKVSSLTKNSTPSDYNFNRYIAVSVERGWTSKRDFVGYFNPLSKTFDKSNRRIYDALKQLDAEKSAGISKFPFLILLDEANLSPMEYYWADFMNVCDDLSDNDEINLGEDNIFAIPETLHFLATINNDHTTETLSPRLIDRAWIIVLPQQATVSVTDSIQSESVELIAWESICAAFVPSKADVLQFSTDIQKIYDVLAVHLKKVHLLISPRTDAAIKKYWYIASQRLVPDEYGTDSHFVAFDYAVAQKILPKISGSGDVFEKWLEDLRDICSANSLNLSARLIRSMIDCGNLQMKYYSFFG